MQNRTVPNPTAATPASSTGRTVQPGRISGPLASTVPNTATPIPTHASALGLSPVATPSSTGTAAPSAATGATTLIVPVDRAA